MTTQKKAEIARLCFDFFKNESPQTEIVLSCSQKECTAHLTALQKAVKAWQGK